MEKGVLLVNQSQNNFFCHIEPKWLFLVGMTEKTQQKDNSNLPVYSTMYSNLKSQSETQILNRLQPRSAAVRKCRKFPFKRRPPLHEILGQDLDSFSWVFYSKNSSTRLTNCYFPKSMDISSAVCYFYFCIGQYAHLG